MCRLSSFVKMLLFFDVVGGFPIIESHEEH